MIRAAAICAAVGIGSSLTEYADLGKWLAALGVLLLIAGLHRFGRMGADAPIVYELAPPRKRKKRKNALRERGSELPAGESEPSTGAAKGDGPAEGES